MNSEESLTHLIPVPADAPVDVAEPEPTRGSRWLLAGLMIFVLLPVQIVLGIPVILVAIVLKTGGDFRPQVIASLLEDFIVSDLAIWLTLGIAALTAILAILLAVFWPRLARSRGHRFSFALWFSAAPPTGPIRLWMVPLITVGAMLLTGLGVTSVTGEAEVDIQSLLFSTPALAIVSTLVVSTLVPVAEELTFRGALYGALLGDTSRQHRVNVPHLIPFIITAIAFAAVHMLAGFDTIGSIVQVFLLSLFITYLRWQTGSVIASITAHAVWNFTAALLLALADYLPF